MILGLDRHPAAECFREIDDAVRALSPGREVVFNAHAFPNEVPKGATIYNLENVPGQLSIEQIKKWQDAGHPVWDFSARSSILAGTEWVPTGYHRSMERFKRLPGIERDIDVVFAGCMNERRELILGALRLRGWRVVHIPNGVYGKERDAYFARARLALNVKFYPDGTFEQLRIAHLVANHVPVISETCEDAFTDWCRCVPYDDIVELADMYLLSGDLDMALAAKQYYQRFRYQHWMATPCL
jgi:hypothetical protein